MKSDLTPRAPCFNRLSARAGVVYSQEKAQKALLREFSSRNPRLWFCASWRLQQTAHRGFEIRQVDYDADGFEPDPGYHATRRN